MPSVEKQYPPPSDGLRNHFDFILLEIKTARVNFSKQIRSCLKHRMLQISHGPLAHPGPAHLTSDLAPIIFSGPHFVPARLLPHWTHCTPPASGALAVFPVYKFFPIDTLSYTFSFPFFLVIIQILFDRDSLLVILSTTAAHPNPTLATIPPLFLSLGFI